MTNEKPERKALIVGASGLVGRYCLQALLAEQRYSEVTALVRRSLLLEHPKLKKRVVDFEHIKQVVPEIEADDIFCCLGSTIKKAGSRQAFRKTDVSLVVAIAELMRSQGAEQFVVISAMGADTQSRFFYNRIKGEMEAAVQLLEYPCLRIIRPSLLLGSRDEFRFAEKLGIYLAPVLKVLLRGAMEKYRPVEAETVARFMVSVAGKQPISGIHVYESNMII